MLHHKVSKVDIVIVNWNSGKQLSDCLASIAQFRGNVVIRVVVVDNKSTDGSDLELEQFGISVHVIRNIKNLGFAHGCNQGAVLGDAPYILFLNPDMRLFEESLQRPLACMEASENSSVGICGIQLLDENGKVARTCARFPSLTRLLVQALGINKLPGFRSQGMAMHGWDHLDSCSVDQVMGAFFLVRRDVFESLNGFDERYFVYFEEVDFSYRAHTAGWRSVYLVDAQAFHAGGGTSEQIKATRLLYSLRSRILYGFKHFPRWQAWILLGVTLLIEPVSRLVFCLVKGQWDSAKDTVRGYRMLWGALSEVLSS